jgi:HD-GYP domain-containing protein (c-di-GMP phosphodiesterase class II)
MIGSELARTYEELVLLYNMSTNMKVTQSNATYLQRACDQITQRIAVEGIAIYLEKKDSYGESLLLTAGSGLVLIEQEMVDILQMHLTEELKNNKDALLDSNIDSPFKYSWPDTVKNIIAVPLMGNEKMFGFMVATNIMNKQDFDSNEVKLFSSVANQCAVFVDNGKLFSDMKELFIGSLKALTSSIDAKDQYTRGHSERVAFISRWIAERFSERYPLEEEYIHKVYLAGLLHDIGKIGISETVLCKNGKLDEEELMQIKSHPRIGATILSEIKQMSEVLQGALCHHERADGKGYPEGLVGDEIPLIGKIISLADAFDAMTSRRIYRDAMDIDHAISQIEEGIGTQFDEKTARVFLDSDIKKLWAIIQDGFIESWDYSNFAEYGALAVGALLR